MKRSGSKTPSADIQAARFFQMLSDGTRLRCLVLLQSQGELCVCELTHALGIIQPKISRHLAALRDAGIVVDRRQGQWIFYRLNEALPGWQADAIDAAVCGAQTEWYFKRDLAALADMPDRPDAICCG